ncbi:trehalose-phosphatase [Algihabitans albus]|uniref:trehalose-phosphatase n=1 Tax=Algihabitans albus TaxID=2164067 RepID=UPI000E5CA037|nr:trehalose-phosphatase [Algihabitans albus]
MDSGAFPRALSRRHYDLVIFDLDGVLTDTAALHARAWKALFDGFLKDRGLGPPFDPESDYRRYVDGRPRLDGIRCFLAAREISVEPDTLTRLAAEKNAAFRHLLEVEGVPLLPANIGFLRQVKAAGFRTAVVSASRNAPAILEAAGLMDGIDTLISGVTAAEEGLAGKPAPDTFLAAAARLGIEPLRSLVVEDAEAGVEAARAGGFGLVIGLAGRGGPATVRTGLAQRGADLVVEDLSEVAIHGDVPLRPAAELPSALEDIEGLRRTADGRSFAFFLDYDGTLTGIVERPDLAVLSVEMRAALAELARSFTVAVVSGRGLDDVRKLVGVPGLIYAGSHGFEIEGPAGLSVQAEHGTEFLPALDAMETALRAGLEAVPGALVERKRFSVAVHYRLVALDDQPRFDAVVDAVLGEHPEFRKGLGKKVYELQPDIEWDKGHAVRWVIDALKLDLREVLPIYIGDDVTDEDAFRALADDGLGILVRDGAAVQTAARYGLESPEDVGRFFTLLLERDA